jgi:DNA-binding NarL/FixJ family response regulator
MRTGSGSISNETRYVIIAGGAQRHWARLKRSFGKSSDIVLVRTSSPLKEVLDECQKRTPCVLVIDYESVAKSDRPTEFTKKIQFGRSIPVLVTIDDAPDPGSAASGPNPMDALLRMGCMGFLEPEVSPKQVRRAVDAVASGEFWAPRKVVSRVLQEVLSPDNPRSMTAREAEILTLVSQGYTNQQIAEALCICRETVRWHMRMLYGKLGVHDRQSAAVHALKPGVSVRKPIVPEKHSKFPARASAAVASKSKR